jgi:transcription termination factor Rho
MDASALRAPKGFVGSAHNIEGRDSLTIPAAALVETASTTDEVLFGRLQEDWEHDTSTRGIEKHQESGTRKEALLYHLEELDKDFALSRVIRKCPLWGPWTSSFSPFTRRKPIVNSSLA